MYVDFINLNILCPKDLYLLSNINRLINESSIYNTLSFIDTYSSYNKIKIELLVAPKTMFISNHGNYYYNIIPFGLKNTCATYQSLINALFYY